MDKNEFSDMVKSVREVEKGIGKVDYTLTSKQIKGRSFSRSLYYVKNILAGEKITNAHIKSIFGFGLHPKYLNILLGKK